VIEKRQPYRNKQITQSANGEECTLHGPRCRYDTEHTVFCHLDELFAGKGGGQKADDIAGFFGCDLCHEDYAKNTGIEYKQVLRAYYRTIRRLIDKGVIA
jgi:hypothetical protein